nr:MAG TPA: hypothetical protein [Caudoviricetes sp.]
MLVRDIWTRRIKFVHNLFLGEPESIDNDRESKRIADHRFKRNGRSEW